MLPELLRSHLCSSYHPMCSPWYAPPKNVNKARSLDDCNSRWLQFGRLHQFIGTNLCSLLVGTYAQYRSANKRSRERPTNVSARGSIRYWNTNWQGYYRAATGVRWRHLPPPYTWRHLPSAYTWRHLPSPYTWRHLLLHWRAMAPHILHQHHRFPGSKLVVSCCQHTYYI